MADAIESIVQYLKQAALDVIVPDRKDVDWVAASSNGKGSNSSDERKLSFAISQRELLYMDEISSVCVALKVPLLGKDVLAKSLPFFEILLETYAVGTARPKSQQQSSQPAPIKDVIDTKTISADEQLLMIDEQSEGDDFFSFAIWPTTVHLVRSRINSSNPSIFFSASMSLKKAGSTILDQDGDYYLKSGVAQSMNLLGAYSLDPLLTNDPPILSAARLAKVKPTSTDSESSMRPLRNVSRQLLRLAPAISSRVQVHKLDASPGRAKVLIALELEASSLISGDVSFNKIDLELADGVVAPLGNNESVSLPKMCRPRDCISLVYDLQPKATDGSLESESHILTFTVEGTVIQSSGLSLFIKMNWRARVDLSSLARTPLSLQPYHSQTASMQRSSTSSYTGTRTSIQETRIRQSLITMTVSGSDDIKAGDTFNWTIQVSNRSRQRTLRLAISPIIRSPESHDGVDASSVTSVETEIIPLSADLRIGPLRPGASASGEIAFKALRAGFISIYGLRITDLDPPSRPRSEARYSKETVSIPGDSGTKKFPGASIYVPGRLLPEITVLQAEDNQSLSVQSET